MGTERCSNYLAERFEPALKVVPDIDRALVDALIRPLEPATAFFRAQMAEGFYGNLTPGADLPKNGDSPYTIIRENRAYNYAEVDPYRRYLKEIARRMEDAIELAIDTHDSEKDLFEITLRPRAVALRQGKFDDVMMLILNTKRAPRYHLFIGLLDRYLDPTRGLKLAMNGVLQGIDPEQNRYYNNLARQIVGFAGGSIPGFRVIFGDMLAAGGMMMDMAWSGNTAPSEDNLRNQLGADSYLFPNNMDKSTRDVDIPAVKQYVPQVTQANGWEETMFKAKRIAITAHETGHAMIPFNEETIKLLGGRYMAVKELLAELFAVTEIARLPRSVIPPAMKPLIDARSLARWRFYVDEHYQETNSNKKAILEHYACAGVWRTNNQERGGGVRINKDGTMTVLDWDRFVELDRSQLQELLSAINNEKYRRGFVDRFIELNSQSPRVYMENNCDAHSSSLQTVVA